MQRRTKSLQSLLLAGACLMLAVPVIASAQSADPSPTDDAVPETLPDPEAAPPSVGAAIELLKIVTAIDEDASLTANGASFTVDGTPVTLVFDVNADRMRLFTRVSPSDALSGSQLRRLMQANFDTALDARYAIAGGQVWSTYMHSLVSLTHDDFVSAIAQTVTLVKTYGTTFSSGALSFGAGDSNAEIQKLLEGLLEDETDI